MNPIAQPGRLTVSLLTFVLITLGGCIAKENGKRTTPTTLYVAVAGNNQNATGSPSRPFATIAAALAQSIPGDTLQVEAGTYETILVSCQSLGIDPNGNQGLCVTGQGETFPIPLARDVTVRGDPATKGAATIVRSNTENPFFLCAPGAVVTGLTLVALDGQADSIFDCSPFSEEGPAAGMQITNNTITRTGGVTGNGIYVQDNQITISGNVISNHAIGIDAQGDLTITDNTVSGNLLGISLCCGDSFLSGNTLRSNIDVGLLIAGAGFVANPDLGGGSLESAGNNVLSCNGKADLQNFNTAALIAAMHNQWDNPAPNQVVMAMTYPDLPAGLPAGQDIVSNTGGGVVVTESSAAAPCP